MTARPKAKPPIVGARRNGWALVTHPAFRERLDALASEVEALRSADNTDAWKNHDKTKLLARVVKVIFEEVPAEPDHAKFEQGNTLGRGGRGWRRAKFFGRFRLFFRFDKRSKIIVYAWVNDESTLRKAGGRTDPYYVFRGMLESGNPPSDWVDLLDACRRNPIDGPAQRVFGEAEILSEPPRLASTKMKRIPKPR